MTQWNAIKRYYIITDLSGSALARRFHVNRAEVCRRIREEHWDQARQDYRCRQTAQAILSLGSAREDRLNRVDSLADNLLTSLEQAAGELDLVTVTFREKIKTENGEQTREFQKILPEEPGTVDRGGLKQLTAVLKDIKDVLMLRSDADTREQEARIAKLQRDLQKEQEQTQVTVTLEGEMREYAN